MIQANYLTEAARMQAWASGLKPGDKVAVSKRGGWGEVPFEVLTVDRLTDSKVLTACGRRFSRAGLHELGVDSGDLGRPHLEPATPAILDAVEAFHLARWLEMTARQRLPLATLRAIKAAHDDMPKGA